MEPKDFNILIEDGSRVLPQLVIDENTSSMELFDWQRRAINYFFKYNKAMFEVCTGCLVGDTHIELPRNLDKYPKGIMIKDLVGKKDFYVYSFNLNSQQIELKRVKNVWLSKKNVDIYEIKTQCGKIIQATKNHPFLIDIKQKPNKGCGRGKREKIVERKYKTVKNLRIGDFVTTFNRARIRSPDGELIKYNYGYKTRRILEHRFILEQIYGKLSKYECGYHINKNRFDNSIINLEKMDMREHSRMHTLSNGFFGKKLWKNGIHPRGMKGKSHSEETKNRISLNTSKAKLGKDYIQIKKVSKFELEGFNSDKFKKNKKESIEKFKKTFSKIPKHLIFEKCSKSTKVRYSDKIVSIKYIGKEDVYDMKVEDNHNFIANNFVVHNSGKTYCAIQILKKILEIDPKVQTLIVVPKNIILEDTWYKELYNAGISLIDIGVYYGNIKEIGKVTITNMQNLQNINFDLFDCVIWDEIHNYGTARLLPYIQKPIKYSIGLSATMERMDGAHWNILKAFDYNLFKYTPKEALRDGVLNPFNFINIGVEMDRDTYDKYEHLTQEINAIMQAGGGFSKLMRTNTGLKYQMLAKMNERKDMVNNYSRKFDVVKEICRKHCNDKIIVFNEYNNQTNKSYWYLLDIGIDACIVHSGISKEKREENMIGFKTDKYSVMLTSKVLDEGFNLPKLDVAIIAAGNSTARQTIQRMGRVLRKKNKESMLYQVYCMHTIEQTYAEERAMLFRELCSDYSELVYGINDKGLKV